MSSPRLLLLDEPFLGLAPLLVEEIRIALDRLREGGLTLLMVEQKLDIALAFARWAIARRCGFRARAPISGQRAMRGETLRAVLPLAPGFGMELGMTVDAVRAGMRVCELELDLSHRATGRTPRGFLHRARQLRDFVRAYRARR